MPKVFELEWILEPLCDDASFLTKPMFGGLCAYYRGKMVAVLMESPGERTYKKIKSPFDLWDGLLIPTSREYHESLKSEFTDLVEHPVLGKWLYLPKTTETFENVSSQIVRLIRREDERFGIIPGTKKRRSKKIMKRGLQKATKKPKEKRS